MQRQSPDSKVIVPNTSAETIQGLSNSTITASPDYRMAPEVRPSWAHQETGENIVATIVDITSIMVAYRLGMDQYGIVSALAYATFDAYIVIWQRKRLTKWVHKLITFISS